MEYQKPVLELIKMRTSTRTYDDTEVDSTTLKRLTKYVENINNEAKIKARFIVTSNHGIESNFKLGTYGVISGAHTFIIGIMDKYEKDAVEFGYLFEKIVLFATDIGLYTCWLGGTFKKSDFIQNIHLLEDEFIPIVSPIGIKKEKPRLLESAMRTVIKANKRAPWSSLFFNENASVPLSEQLAGSYAIPLEMVRLGPSASNKQPWRIIKDGDLFHFYLCRTKGYGVTSYDMQKNDIGIAKCHFELSAHETQLKGEWVVMDNMKTPNEWEYITTWSSDI